MSASDPRLEAYVRAAMLEWKHEARRLRGAGRADAAGSVLRQPGYLRQLAQPRDEYVIDTDWDNDGDAPPATARETQDPETGRTVRLRKVGERPARDFDDATATRMAERLQALWREAVNPQARTSHLQVLGEQDPGNPVQRLRDLTAAILWEQAASDDEDPETSLRLLCNAVERALEHTILGGPRSQFRRLVPLDMAELERVLDREDETVAEAETRHARLEAQRDRVEAEGPALFERAPAQWEVVELMFAGHDDDEIAEIRSCEPSTVRGLRMKALAKLARHFADDG